MMMITVDVDVDVKMDVKVDVKVDVVAILNLHAAADLHVVLLMNAITKYHVNVVIHAVADKTHVVVGEDHSPLLYLNDLQRPLASAFFIYSPLYYF